MVPIWLDAGIAINDNWYVGAYFQYGVGSIPNRFASACNTQGVSCTIFDCRLGGNVQLRTQTGRDQFWAGLGSGYEWYGIDLSVRNQTPNLRLGGWEFVNIQAGYDYLAKRTGGLGAFVALTLAQFTDLSTQGTDVPFTPSRQREPQPVDTPPPEVTNPDAEDRKPGQTEQLSTPHLQGAGAPR